MPHTFLLSPTDQKMDMQLQGQPGEVFGLGGLCLAQAGGRGGVCRVVQTRTLGLVLPEHPLEPGRATARPITEVTGLISGRCRLAPNRGILLAFEPPRK